MVVMGPGQFDASWHECKPSVTIESNFNWNSAASVVQSHTPVCMIDTHCTMRSCSFFSKLSFQLPSSFLQNVDSRSCATLKVQCIAWYIHWRSWWDEIECENHHFLNRLVIPELFFGIRRTFFSFFLLQSNHQNSLTAVKFEPNGLRFQKPILEWMHKMSREHLANFVAIWLTFRN